MKSLFLFYRYGCIAQFKKISVASALGKGPGFAVKIVEASG